MGEFTLEMAFVRQTFQSKTLGSVYNAAVDLWIETGCRLVEAAAILRYVTYHHGHQHSRILIALDELVSRGALVMEKKDDDGEVFTPAYRPAF